MTKPQQNAFISNKGLKKINIASCERNSISKISTDMIMGNDWQKEYARISHVDYWLFQFENEYYQQDWLIGQIRLHADIGRMSSGWCSLISCGGIVWRPWWLFPQKPILQMLGGNSQQQSVIYIFGWLLYTVPLFGALRVVTGSGSNCHSAFLACLGTISWHLTASRENIIEKRLITSLHQNNEISLHIPSTIHSLWIVKPNKPTNVNMLS